MASARKRQGPLPRQPHIEILELGEDHIKFKLTKTDLSVANALRRIMIAEVPTLAIDLVNIEENSSVLCDEYIAHRLGLVPIKYINYPEFKKMKKAWEDCVCNEYCDKCSQEFEINVKAPAALVSQYQDITSKDIISTSGKSKAVCFSSEAEESRYNSIYDGAADGGIRIVGLGRGQSFKAHCVAKKSIGKEHAKWSPVAGCTFKQQPVVRLNYDQLDKRTLPEQKELVACCPAKVFYFDEDSEKVEVGDETKCIRCGECTRLGVQEWKCLVDDNIVEVGFQKETYIFTVESIGQLEPENIVLCALEILQNKLFDLYSQDEGDVGADSDAATFTPMSSDYSNALSASDGSESEGVANDWSAAAAGSSTFD